MPRTFFKVSIGHCAAELQPLSKSTTVDPYLRINFAGDYKKFSTAVRKKTFQPNWGDLNSNFFYNTTFAHRLNVKYLVIECLDHNTIKSDSLLGSCKIDLLTLAAGPKHHQLTLMRENGTPGGTLALELDMSEELKDFGLQFANVSFPNWNAQSMNPLARLYFEYAFSETPDVSLESGQLAATTPVPTWKEIKPLTLNTDMNVLLEEKTRVVFTVKMAVPGSPDAEVGKAHLDILSVYRPDQEVVQFNLQVINDSQAVVATMVGDAAFSKGPQFMQMQGDQKTALHHDKGITFLGRLRDGWPLPPNYKPSAEAIAIPQSSMAMVRPAEVVYAAPQMPAYASSPPAAGAGGSMSIGPSSSALPTTLTGGSGAGAGAAGATGPTGPGASAAAQPPAWIVAYKASPRQRLMEDDAEPMPRHYTMAQDAKGYVYFKYKPTQKTTWQDPRFLPEGWEQRISKDGQLFFAFTPAKSTTWVDPRGMPPGWTMVIEEGLPTPIFQYLGKEGEQSSNSSMDPRGLPPGFTMHYDPKRNREYFKNHHNHSTSWDDPRKFEQPQRLMQFRQQERQAWDVAQLKRVLAERKQFEDSKSAAIEEKKKQLSATWESRFSEIARARKVWFTEKQNDWNLQQVLIKSDAEAKLLEIEKEETDFNRTQKAAISAFELEMLRQRKELEHKLDMEALTVKGKLDAQRDDIKADRKAKLAQFEAKKDRELKERAAEQKKAEEALQAEFDAEIEKVEKEATVYMDQYAPKAPTGPSAMSTGDSAVPMSSGLESKSDSGYAAGGRSPAAGSRTLGGGGGATGPSSGGSATGPSAAGRSPVFAARVASDPFAGAAAFGGGGFSLGGGAAATGPSGPTGPGATGPGFAMGQGGQGYVVVSPQQQQYTLQQQLQQQQQQQYTLQQQLQQQQQQQYWGGGGGGGFG